MENHNKRNAVLLTKVTLLSVFLTLVPISSAGTSVPLTARSIGEPEPEPEPGTPRSAGPGSPASVRSGHIALTSDRIPQTHSLSPVNPGGTGSRVPPLDFNGIGSASSHSASARSNASMVLSDTSRESQLDVTTLRIGEPNNAPLTPVVNQNTSRTQTGSAQSSRSTATQSGQSSHVITVHFTSLFSPTITIEVKREENLNINAIKEKILAIVSKQNDANIELLYGNRLLQDSELINELANQNTEDKNTVTLKLVFTTNKPGYYLTSKIKEILLQVKEYFKGETVVYDKYEHLSAADKTKNKAAIVSFIERLIDNCQGSSALMTSQPRNPLRIDILLQVGSINFWPGEDKANYSAVLKYKPDNTGSHLLLYIMNSALSDSQYEASIEYCDTSDSTGYENTQFSPKNTEVSFSKCPIKFDMTDFTDTSKWTA